MRKFTRSKGNIKGLKAIIEAVEQRTLLSGAAIANGVLTVTGTSQQDVIIINFDASSIDGSFSVKINGSTTNLSATGVNELLVNGEAGNDSININTGAQGNTGEQSTSVVVNDGDGNDSIELDLPPSVDGTLVTSKITAGNGNDNIFVQAGTSSTVTVGNGNDTVGGSASEDNLVMTINVGNGNDQINGQSAGDASLVMHANVGTGHDTYSDNDDVDIVVEAQTSTGQSSGAFSGGVFIAGQVDLASSAPLPGATVFLDANDNGILDPGEITATTDAHGNYTLATTSLNFDVPVNYDVRAIAPGFTVAPSVLTETTQAGQGFSGDNFTATPIPTAADPALFGTAGSYNNQGNTIANAVDGNLSTFFDSPTASGGFVALDYGLPQTIKQISFAPRSTLPGRMVGGLFQGSNSPDFSSAVTLYTVTTTPAIGKLTTVNISNTGTFRFVRYLGPSNSYCNIAEMKFTLATSLTGTVIGTTGSYRSQGNTAAHVFDGNVNTFFDAPDATGDWAGLDLGTAKIITQISYAPRSGWASRMVGGMFQASNSADFSSGVATLYTITSIPTTGVLTTVQVVNFSAYRYVRYIGPADGYSNIAEAQFSGATPATGAYLQSGGTLVVDGTSNADTITLTVESQDSPNSDTVIATVNGVAHTFSLTNVLQVVINAGAGNDTVTLNGFDEGPNDITGHGYEAITVNGGDGNDTITNDIEVQDISIGEPILMDGGAGNDTIFDGGDGIATIIGGDGDDSFDSSGYPGLTVSIYGGDGNDTVFTDGDTDLAVYDGGAGTNTLDTTRNPTPATNTFNINLNQYVNVHNLVLGALSDVTVTGTSGDDTITGIDVGDNNVSINGGGGNDTDYISGGETVVIDDSGPGSNNITVVNSYVVNVIGGNGNDTIHVRNNNGPVTIDGGPGVDTAYTDPGATVTNVEILNPDQSHAKLTGTIIGTSGSYRNHGTTIANVFDNNLTTFFDAPDATGDWVGLDLGSAQVVTQVKYAPRAGWESRMVGGEIQASNTADFSSGVVTLFTIGSTPTAGVLTTQSISNTTAYRYYRYIGPANSYCDIAELEFDS